MKHELKTDVGQKIRQIRSLQKLNQDDYATKTYVSKDHISKVENGKLYPSFKLMQSLLEKFDVDLNWLIAGSGNIKLHYAPPIDDISKVDEEQGEYVNFKDKYIEVMEENRILNEKLRKYMEKKLGL